MSLPYTSPVECALRAHRVQVLGGSQTPICQKAVAITPGKSKICQYGKEQGLGLAFLFSEAAERQEDHQGDED
ncbi:MAG: hypothetical protein JWR08_2071 [Enterovirga sp.]|jgi:hypothetical protein|nr:hypothetical protein [Enterovirga sp.]